MSKVNQVLFELVTHNTIQNQFLHICLIGIDYYPIIISSLTSIFKIENFSMNYNQISTKLEMRRLELHEFCWWIEVAKMYFSRFSWIFAS